MFNIKKILLIFSFCILHSAFCTVFIGAQETITLPETQVIFAIPETPTLAVTPEAYAEVVIAETQTISETVAIKSETITIETKVISVVEEIIKEMAETKPLAETITLIETKPVVAPPLSTVKAGLSLMPTAYVRVSQKHPGETGFNADFLFNFYIGEIYEYINNRHIFFVPYRIFTFGVDTKLSFTIGRFLKALGLLYENEYVTEKVSNLLDYFDPDSYKQEQKYLPTLAVGLRGWLFRSMGPSFDIASAFEGAQWIIDYYVVGSKKIGGYRFHLGYVYGNFVNRFFGEIKTTNRTNQGQMGTWNIKDDSHTLFVGFDMNIPWGMKKFSVEGIFSSLDTFLINTSTGLWGFDLAFLKIPTGFTIIGYWSFRSNIFTFF